MQQKPLDETGEGINYLTYDIDLIQVGLNKTWTYLTMNYTARVIEKVFQGVKIVVKSA